MRNSNPYKFKEIKSFARACRNNENWTGYCLTKNDSKEDIIRDDTLTEIAKETTLKEPPGTLIIRYGNFIIKMINGLFDVQNLNTDTTVLKAANDLNKVKRFIDNIHDFNFKGPVIDFS